MKIKIECECGNKDTLKSNVFNELILEKNNFDIFKSRNEINIECKDCNKLFSIKL